MNTMEKLQRIYHENRMKITRLEEELSLFKEKSKKKKTQKEILSFLLAIPLSLGALLLARLGCNALPAMAKNIVSFQTPLVLLGFMAGFNMTVKKGYERMSGVWKEKKDLLRGRGKTRQEQEEEILKKEILKKKLENRNNVIEHASKNTSIDSSLEEASSKGKKDALKKSRKNLFLRIQRLKENYQQLDKVSTKQVIASKLQYYQSIAFEEEKLLSELKGLAYALASYFLSFPFMPQVNVTTAGILVVILLDTSLIACAVPAIVCEQKKKRNIKMLVSMSQGEGLELKVDENCYNRTRKVEMEYRKILDQTISTQQNVLNGNEELNQILSCERKEEKQKTGTKEQERLAAFFVEAMAVPKTTPIQNTVKPKTFSKQLGLSPYGK